MRIVLSLLIVFVLGACASGTRPLQLTTARGPVYPTEARAQGIEGEVVVQYDVTVDGQVINAQVIKAEPPGVFDDAALDAVRQWRFVAPKEKGVSQPAPGRQSTVTFRVDSDDKYSNY